MKTTIKLTQGAFRLLAQKYASILGKCAAAASLCLMLAAPAPAADDIPKPGTSFQIDSDMEFIDKGNLSYDNITLKDPDTLKKITLTLDRTNINAVNVEIERVGLNAENSSLSSSGVLRIQTADLVNARLLSKDKLVLSGPLNSISGDNILESSGSDIYMGNGESYSPDSTLTLKAAGEIIGGRLSDYRPFTVRANNIISDAMNMQGNTDLENGVLINKNAQSPSFFYGPAQFTNMDSQLGMFFAYGAFTVTGGKFNAGLASFNDGAAFTDVEANIDGISASAFSQAGGSLSIGANPASQIRGGFSIENADANIGVLKVDGKTTVTGGTFKGGSLDLAETTFSNVRASIANLNLRGPLSLLDHASLTANASGIGQNEVTINASELNLDGDFSTAKLNLADGALNVSGNLQIDLPTFDLKNSKLTAANARLGDLTSSGESSIEAKNSIITGDVTITGGSLSLAATGANATISGASVHISAGAAASLLSSQTSFTDIAGTGSLAASNLRLERGLNLESGKLELSGQNVIGGNLELQSINGALGDITVQGATALKDASLSAGAVNAGDLSSSGQSAVKAENDITLANAVVNSGSLSLTAGQNLSGKSLHIAAGAAASLISSQTSFTDITGTGSLTAGNLRLERDLTLEGGKLELSGQNVIGGNLALISMAGSLGDAAIHGSATLDNAVLNGNSVSLQDIASAGQSALHVIGNIEAGNIDIHSGSLSLYTSGENGTISGKSVRIGEGAAASLLSSQTSFNDIAGTGSLAAHNLTLKEDLQLAAGQLKLSGVNAIGRDLALDNVQGSLGDISVAGTTALKDAILGAGKASLRDLASSGQTTIVAGGDLNLANVAVNSGRLILDATENAASLTGDTLYIQNGGVASVRSAHTVFNNIHGTGSLDAHNLDLRQNLSLEQGSLTLSGDNRIGGDLHLSLINASVNNLEVKGATDLKASTITGKSISLGQGARLDASSSLEARILTTGQDIVLANSAELVAGTINLGEAHLVLEGASGQRAVAAVGDFASGDLTVDANSMLSIGNIMPDWVNMGMDGHKASAALGLWTPFELGSGANANIGAGSLARGRAAGGNQINFTSDSLLITNASVASKDGRGAISAQTRSDANIQAGAKLHILHAKEDGLYRVLGENINVNYDGNAWQGDNVRTDSALIKLERLEGDKLGWFQAKKPGSGSTLPDLSPDFRPPVDNPGTEIKPETPPNTPPANKPIQPDKPSAPETPPSKPDVPVTPTPPVNGGTTAPTPTPPSVTPPPVTPDNPSNPGTPDTPSNPGQPSNPSTPDNPSQPGNPTQPGNPSTPGTPDNPTQPGNPSNPGTPDNPSNPGTPDNPSNPGTPDTPSNPGQPSNPSTPDNPGQPGNPSNPGTPDNPSNPGTPDNPSNPGTPGQPDNPSNPGQPSNPSTPGNPGQPDNPNQPGNPSNPGQPDQPDNPDQPSNPSTPDKPDQPDKPQEPGEPSNPDNPDNPDKPDEPAEPEQPEEPDEPYLPEEPDPDKTPVIFQTAGQKFLSRATNFWFIGHDARLAAKTIESAGRIFALGAVPELTMAANQAGVSAMQARTGAGNPAGGQAMGANGELLANDPEAWHGFALWITPLYKSVNGYGLTSGNWATDVNGGLGGVAIGGDYTFANYLRAGLSFNIGGGYAHGNGELADTTNNMSFWGVGAYAGWNWNNFDISADAAFTSTYNKLKQELHPGMQMEDLKSDITAWALSAGLEFGWTLPTKYVDIRPHAGAHFTHLHNDAYDVNSEGTVLEGKEKGIDVWTFPLGISFQKQFEFANGWHLRPILDLAVVPAAGDTKAKSEVRFTGTAPWVTTKDQFMDDISYRGSLGLELGSDNLAFGLNYAIQAGMKTDSQTVMGTFVYTF